MVETAVFGFFHRARPVAPEYAAKGEPSAVQSSEPVLAANSSEAPQKGTEPLLLEPIGIEGPVPGHERPTTPAPPQVEAGDPAAKPNAVVSVEGSTVAPQPEASNNTNAGTQPQHDVEVVSVVTTEPGVTVSAVSAGIAGAASDQLGVASIETIRLTVTLPNSGPVMLDARQAGLYVPNGNGHERVVPDQVSLANAGLAAGTRVLTARGEIEVEAIDSGDFVLALRGPSLLSVRWVGTGPAAEAPVWIEAGALGHDLPRRSLCVGPDQPLFVDPNPVLARTLVNGSTIRQLDDTQSLYLIDVGMSDVLFAEGVPLSSGDRAHYTELQT